MESPAVRGGDPPLSADHTVSVLTEHLTPEEACAFDVATAQRAGGVLPGAIYCAARDLLGQDALNEFILWIGTYAQAAHHARCVRRAERGGIQSMTTIHVTYAGDAGTRFDRDDYVRHHLPPVRQCWALLGLKSCAGFWPADMQAGTVCICECRFRDAAAITRGTRLARDATRDGRCDPLH